ncbi:Uncharacterised protein [Yersinia rohdei]|uniref:hypothetical protein n=1 Tax=Yersinia rohdei TaxID=29485 RepID=UPI0005E7E0FA|nr:hypothetical protein [Yersinia rohdei]CNI84465.1 Uncharacterised protein [Yersinia rohdei]
MATSSKKYKITYYSDDMELLNKMAFIAKQFDIKSEELGAADLLKSSAVVLNEDYEDFNKSARQESNNELLQAIKEKYK